MMKKKLGVHVYESDAIPYAVFSFQKQKEHHIVRHFWRIKIKKLKKNEIRMKIKDFHFSMDIDSVLT